MDALGVRVVLGDDAGEPGADEHAGAEGEDGMESLRGGAEAVAGGLVDIHAAHDEDEVIAHAVQQDAAEDHPGRGGLLVEVGEEGEAGGPGGHAEDHDALGAEDRQEDREQEQEADFGELTEGHLGGVVGDVHLAQEGAGPGEVEAERDADQEGADHEDREGAVLEEPEGVKAEQLAGRHGAGVTLGRGVREGERVERDGDGDTTGEGEHAVVVGEFGEVDHVGGGDPAGGGRGHDDREPLGGIRGVGEGDGVDEAVSGHVGQRVDDQRRVEDAEGGLLRDPPEQAGP